MRIVSGTTIRSSTLSRTIGYYGALSTFGLIGATWGPTLPYLASATDTEVARLGIIFTALALGAFLGTTLGGRIFDKVVGHPVMVAALITMAVIAFLIPQVSALTVLVLIIFILGAAAGLMTVGGNTLIVWIHQENVGPWLNGLHFFSGVGAVISPLVVTFMVVATGSAAGAFWILALIILVPAVWLLLVSSPTIRSDTEEIAGGQINFKLVIPIALIFLLYVGTEVSFSGWLFTVTVAEHPGSDTSAGYLTAAFWASITLGRLVAIPISKRVVSRKILFTDFVGTLIGFGIIIALSSSLAFFWIGTIVLGLAMASVFPTLLTYAENRLKLTGRVSGWFFGASALGGMTMPFLVGQLFTTAGPRSIMIFLFFAILMALIVFAGIEYARQARSSKATI